MGSKKAFDSLEHSGIAAALRAWGFIGKLGKLAFRPPTAVSIVVGVRGTPNPRRGVLRRGIKAGGPEAPVIFVLVPLWVWAGVRLIGELGCGPTLLLVEKFPPPP